LIKKLLIFTLHHIATSINNLTSYWANDLPFAKGRAVYDAVLLPNEKVMACGGLINITSVTATCEFYSSSTGWVFGPSMKVYRYSHTLTLFDNNTKVLAAGTQLTGYQQTAEVYDNINNR
jgi:hypothetical protein